MPYSKSQDSLVELGHLIAEASKNVVFVVGAGLSVPAGLPSWATLIKNLTDEAVASITTANESEEVKERNLARLRSFKDPWLIGDEIARLLAPGRYVELVKGWLNVKDVPATYDALWDLSPSGVISFNLDQLAERSMRGTDERVASATEVNKFPRFLLLAKPFLFQPHGRLAHPESWVLRGTARDRLLKDNQYYRRFIHSLLSTRRLVIVGFEPSDFAFESLLLEDFRTPLEEGAGHFWITPTLSDERREWAKLKNIAPIEYAPQTAEHAEVFDILTDLKSIRPREPVVSAAYDGLPIDPSELPPDGELRSEPIDQIRAKLNAALRAKLLEPDLSHDQQMDTMRRFRDNYSGSVHMAWHILEGGDYGRIMGYKVLNRLGGGAFASVWRVRDPVDGTIRALKVLREETLEDFSFVEAFRRGVNAMKILRDRQVSGMVKFVEAFDIPACVFMEFIDGHGLDVAIANKAITDLPQALEIMEEVAKIVNAAHELRERVLHRDLKPSNVMLRNLYNPSAEIEVVVLDFDLSWYEGALGRSIASGFVPTYCAPEQLRKTARFSSRHTAVDVFGLGMLLFFVCTGADPALNAQNTKGFAGEIESAFAHCWPGTHPAIVRYLAILIIAATRDSQSERIAMSGFIERLRQCLKILRSDAIDIPSDLALLAAGSGLDLEIWKRSEEFDKGRLQFESTTSGASCMLYFREINGEPVLAVEFVYAEAGQTKRGNVQKYLAVKLDKMIARLRRDNLFTISERDEDRGRVALRVYAASKGKRTSRWFQDLANCLAECAGMLALD